MSYRFVFLLIALCFISCQGPKQKPIVQEETGISSVLPGQDVLTVDLDSIAYEKQMPLSAFFKDVRYIPLETTRESLLGRINQLCMQRDTILFWMASWPGRYLCSVRTAAISVWSAVGEKARPSMWRQRIAA